MAGDNGLPMLEDKLFYLFDLIYDILAITLELLLLLLALRSQAIILILKVLLPFESLQLLGKLFQVLVKFLFKLKCLCRELQSRRVQLFHLFADLFFDFLKYTGI